MIKKSGFSDWLLLAALTLAGGFYEYVSCLLTAAMCLYLLLRVRKTGELSVGKSIWLWVAAAISLGYGVTCLWAVDRGMALIGFVKFLPPVLYLLCLQQERTDGAQAFLPLLGGVMTLVSAVGMQFSGTKQLFSVAGRLAGFFQYPNTFAVFLLVCQLLLVKKQGKKLWDYLLMAVLVAGLLYTGSRTALVVAVLANGAMLLCVANRKTRWLLLGGMALVAGVVGVLALNEHSVLHRYLNISVTQSTFVGRLLYWSDGLKLLLKYPFGMGYMGYFYAQGGVQTGVYSVAFAHNDFLQFFLDIGFVPGGLLLGALIAWFCRREIPGADKVIVGAVCLHSFFDFDLQYVGVLLLLLYLVSRFDRKPAGKWKLRLPGKVGAAAVAAVSVYMAVALLAANLGAYDLADALYPWNTQAQLKMLEQAEDLNSADGLADRILARNTHYYAPYTVKAKSSLSRGEIGDMIRYQKTALERNPFDHTQYDAYCQMLMQCWQRYAQTGDTQSAQACIQYMVDAQRLLAQNSQRLSFLGKQIDDQPVTVLSEEIQRFLTENGK